MFLENDFVFRVLLYPSRTFVISFASKIYLYSNFQIDVEKVTG